MVSIKLITISIASFFELAFYLSSPMFGFILSVYIGPKEAQDFLGNKKSPIDDLVDVLKAYYISYRQPDYSSFIKNYLTITYKGFRGITGENDVLVLKNLLTWPQEINPFLAENSDITEFINLKNETLINALFIGHNNQNTNKLLFRLFEKAMLQLEDFEIPMASTTDPQLIKSLEQLHKEASEYNLNKNRFKQLLMPSIKKKSESKAGTLERFYQHPLFDRNLLPELLGYLTSKKPNTMPLLEVVEGPNCLGSSGS